VSLATEAFVTDNPYVGPRPYREADRREGRALYGRDREARDVLVMLLAERILLVHSPSGAGKTSLLQAKVIPELRDDEGFDVSGPLRVNAVPVDSFQPRNRYSWSIIVGILGAEAAANEEFADMTLTRFLGSDHDPFRDSAYRVLVLDQFEEILTLDPGDRDGQTAFFVDLGAALKSSNCWALLSMREDFMGGLASYASLVPSHLKVRYRIDFLGHAAAMEAAMMPAKDAGVEFHPKAASALVTDLAKVRRQLPGEQKATTLPGPYVEPVQLQAACTELWRRLKEERGAGFRKISVRDVKDFGDLDAALGAYYANAVSKVARKTGTSERVIRDWFEEKLITEDGEFRNQTQTGPPIDGDVEMVLRELADHYLIRSDQRGATTWYELAHDRLIGPLCADNRAWRYRHLDTFEISALEWDKAGRSDTYLLGPVRLGAAMASLSDQRDASSLLREYVEASEEWARDQLRKRRREQLIGAFGIATVILGLVVIVETVFLLVLLLS
jgi:hypothetical protein